MARIPLTQFGNQVAAGVPGPGRQAALPDVRVPVQAFGVGAEIERAGQAVAAPALGELLENRRREDAEADRQRRKAEAEAAHEAEKRRRLAGATAYQTYENDADETLSAIETDLRDGRIARADVPKRWAEESKRLRQERFGTLAPVTQEELAPQLVNLEGKARRVLSGLVAKNEKDEHVATFNTMVEELGRLALRDPSAAMSRASALYGAQGEALLGREGARKGLQAFKESAAATYLTEQVNRARGSYAGLQRVQKAIDGDDLLDPAKKVALSGQVQGQLIALEHRGQIEAEKRARKADSTWQAITGLYDRGVQPDAAFAAQAAAALKGTPYEAGLAQLQKTGKDFVGFGAMPVTQQARTLEGLYAERQKGGSNPAAEERIGKLETIHKNTVAGVKENPWREGLERGWIDAIPELSLDPANLGAGIAARVEAAKGLDVATGRTTSPLTNDEAAQLSKMIAGQPVEDRERTLRELGKVIEPPRMRALAEQMGKENPTIGRVAWLAASGLGSTKDRSLATLYMKGEDALRQGTAKIDAAKETGVRAEIYKALAGAYRTPQATDEAADVALKVYAGMKADGSGDVQRAVRLATGGLYDGGGWKVPKPYGWTDNEFRTALRGFGVAKVDEAAGGQGLKAGPVPVSVRALADALPNTRLLGTGQPGVYEVQVGNNIVTTDDQQPFRINLTR